MSSGLPGLLWTLRGDPRDLLGPVPGPSSLHDEHDFIFSL